MASVYNNCKASLLKYCTSMAPNLKTTDFDSHASVEKWPDSDLIGIAEYSIENQQEMYEITVMIAVSSKADDVQMDRMLPVVNTIFDDLVPLKRIDIVDATSGAVIGNFVVTGSVHVLPPARTKTRPVIMIAVSLAATFLDPP